MNINTIGEALNILLEYGELSLKKNQEVYKSISTDWNMYNQLNELANSIGLYIVNYNECYYISAMPKCKTFAYSNEELRRELNSQFNNIDLYLVLLIIGIFITEVSPDGSEPKVSLITLNDFISCVEKKFEYFASMEDLEKVSVENSYNLFDCLNRWNELLPVNRNQNDEISEKGKNSRYQICMTAIKFMEKQKLVKLSGVDEKNIYIQDRFKAIIGNTYNNTYVQNQIFDVIQSAGGSFNYD